MKRTNRCPKCGSKDVVADAEAVGRCPGSNQADITVATYRKPDAIIFKGQQDTTISAWVCGDCGFVEFYADSPKARYAAKDNVQWCLVRIYNDLNAPL